VGQLEAMEVHHPLFKARLFLQGAHLTQFAPRDDANWLWVSDDAIFKPGQAIRGGIPICWPWFGVPDKNPPEVRRRILTGASHGFARTAVWKLEDVRETAHEVEISLSLHANQDFADAWNGNALCLATFTLGAESFRIALTTTNLDNSPLALTQALHTYLPTHDIAYTRLKDSKAAYTSMPWITGATARSTGRFSLPAKPTAFMKAVSHWPLSPRPTIVHCKPWAVTLRWCGIQARKKPNAWRISLTPAGNACCASKPQTRFRITGC